MKFYLVMYLRGNSRQQTVLVFGVAELRVHTYLELSTPPASRIWGNQHAQDHQM
jgi:hypothetical protein